ncbi:hypothetical protein BCCH1_80920 (plasmid) [Burkholderia contaminans]|uniref:Uncharacterized protein n=1 Tax=Burkholderia contaminans TaxID=488447 RepID=A0A286T6P1_9BURK|nr:hypothetical protein BCCH1_80920 [Burkholderia contaminans]
MVRTLGLLLIENYWIAARIQVLMPDGRRENVCHEDICPKVRAAVRFVEGTPGSTVYARPDS